MRIALNALGFFLFLACPVIAVSAEPQGKAIPKWAEVRKAVVRYFEVLPEYQPGGILARGEVQPLQKVLKKQGWEVADWTSLVSRVPADDSFLVRRLRTRDGRKFMTQVYKYPHGYDRLDRVSQLARGHALVDELVRGPEGYKMIQYMTETTGGETMGSMLGNTPLGKDFNKPTGQIYTMEMLLDDLKERYAETRKDVKKSNPPAKKPPES